MEDGKMTREEFGKAVREVYMKMMNSYDPDLAEYYFDGAEAQDVIDSAYEECTEEYNGAEYLDTDGVLKRKEPNHSAYRQGVMPCVYTLQLMYE